MSEFETKLLRLVALGILILGSVGLYIAHPRGDGAAFWFVAVSGMAVIAGGFVVEFARRLWNWIVTSDWRTESEKAGRG